MSLRKAFAAAAVAAFVTMAGCQSSEPATAPALTEQTPPPIRHVFVIVLENEGYDATFGASPGSPYLAKTMTGMGALLTQYYGTGHASLDNYVAMFSGQGPNAATQADCAYYLDFAGDIPPGSADGQAVGQGCVYPVDVKTIGNQLSDAHLTWRQYGQDMALGVPALPAACRHPPLNSQDGSQGTSNANAGDHYATRHVPAVYFHSIIDDQAYCDAHVVDLKELDADLADAARTPNFVFITPNVCADGHDATCADQPGGYAGIEAFLQEWIPKIMNSPAYQQDGMILTMFDEADTGDSTACCNEQAANSPAPGISGSGGGRVGGVLISPFTRPGTVSDAPYNHYSMLRSVETLFGLNYLGYAGQEGLKGFGADVYNTTPPAPTPTPPDQSGG